MVPPGHPLGGIVHVLHPLDPERNILKFLQRHQLASFIPVGLKNILDYLHSHSPPRFPAVPASSLISPENIPGIYLLFHIIQTFVVPVRNNCVAHLLKLLQVINHD